MRCTHAKCRLGGAGRGLGPRSRCGGRLLRLWVARGRVVPAAVVFGVGRRLRRRVLVRGRFCSRLGRASRILRRAEGLYIVGSWVVAAASVLGRGSRRRGGCRVLLLRAR